MFLYKGRNLQVGWVLYEGAGVISLFLSRRAAHQLESEHLMTAPIYKVSIHAF